MKLVLLALAIALPAAVAQVDIARSMTMCSGCHRKEVAGVSKSGMAHALSAAAAAPILIAHPKLSFQQGQFQYTIERRGDQVWYVVTDGRNTLSEPIGWAFGLGEAGQTYVIKHNGAWFESRVSYYHEIDGLDLTVGANPEVPLDLETAIGRQLPGLAANECFDCHATGALQNNVLHTEALIPGVLCKRCHTGVDAHITALQQGQGTKNVPRRLGELTTEDLSDFCGQCHRTWSQIAASGPHNVSNVRFQPYRLANSKCYDSADPRIRCTTCHDPHQEVIHQASYYDSRCQACHQVNAKQGAVKVCKVGNANCVTCHMPKTALPGGHHTFTDHWIRVVKLNDPYPG